MRMGEGDECLKSLTWQRRGNHSSAGCIHTIEQYAFGDSLPFNRLSCMCTSGLWPGTTPCTQAGREWHGRLAEAGEQG